MTFYHALFNIFAGFLGIFLAMQTKIFIRNKMPMFAMTYSLTVLLTLLSFSSEISFVLSVSLLIFSIAFLLFGLNVIKKYNESIKD